MSNAEQIKQKIAIELENARLWGTFLLPSIGLLLAIIFTGQYFNNEKLAKASFSTLITAFVLFAIYMRNEHLRQADDHIKKLSIDN